MSVEVDYTKIEEACERADLVLVGIGDKFQYNWDILHKQKRYMQIEAEIAEKEKNVSGQKTYKWIIPFLQKMALEKYPDESLVEAYRGLTQLISEHNYFIISMIMDDYLYQCDLRQDRIVTPCGGFRKMQCDHNCGDEILDIDHTVYDRVMAYYKEEIPLNALCEPRCAKCGQPVRFNQIGVSVYAEKGYLPQWEQYTKWLQGTVNRTVCILELGVGLELPNLIRWPFERIAYYNQKAILYRIHPFLYQTDETLKGRSIGICLNPADFLSNRFVK